MCCLPSARSPPPFGKALEGARRTAKSVWVLADCCRAAPGLAPEKQATGRNLRQGVDEAGNLILCTASEGDRPSYESDALRHGIFTQAWLEVLEGKVGRYRSCTMRRRVAR